MMYLALTTFIAPRWEGSVTFSHTVKAGHRRSEELPLEFLARTGGVAGSRHAFAGRLLSERPFQLPHLLIEEIVWSGG